MNRKTIVEFYTNLIDDIKDQEVKEKLLNDLEEIDDMMYLLEDEVDKQLDYEEDRCTSQEEMWNDYEASRKELVLWTTKI